MSFVYLPVRAGESSGASCSGGGSSAMSKTTPIASKFSKPVSKMTSMTTHPSGTTLEHSTGDPGVDAWILLLRDFRASRSRSQANGQEPTTSAICGPTRSALLAKYDLDSHSWKTSQGFLALDTLEPSSVIFPKSGTMQGGQCWELVMSAHRTDGGDFGYWPTPNATDWKRTPMTDKYANKPLKDGLPDTLPQLCARECKCGTQMHRHEPRFAEFVMGWPIGLTDLKPLGTGKFQQWLEQHGCCSVKDYNDS